MSKALTPLTFELVTRYLAAGVWQEQVIHELVDAHDGAKEALCDQTRRVTYADLAAESNSLARFLLDAGVEDGAGVDRRGRAHRRRPHHRPRPRRHRRDRLRLRRPLPAARRRDVDPARALGPGGGVDPDRARTRDDRLGGADAARQGAAGAGSRD